MKTSWKQKKIELKSGLNPPHNMSRHQKRVKGVRGPALLFAPHPGL